MHTYYAHTHTHTHAQVCEWDAKSEVFNVVGTAGEVMWAMESWEKFSVTFGKGAAIYNGHIRYLNRNVIYN